MLRCYCYPCYDPEEGVDITFDTEESAVLHELAVHKGATTCYDQGDTSGSPRDPFAGYRGPGWEAMNRYRAETWAS